MSTFDNLKEAFAGESQANRKYLAFAKKAEKEGFPQVAKLFRAGAEAETVHAHNHLKVLGGVKDTVENIKSAIEGEGSEFKEMYPKFLAEAEKEADDKAVRTFKYALKVEEVHHGLFSSALEAVQSGKDFPEEPVYICSVCGNTFIGEPPGQCPICGALKSKFVEIQ